MSQMGNVDFIDPVTAGARAGTQGVAANANAEADRALQRAQIAAQAGIAKANIDAQKTMQHASLDAESMRQDAALTAQQKSQQESEAAQSASQSKQIAAEQALRQQEIDAQQQLFTQQKQLQITLHNSQLKQLDAGTAEAEKYQGESDSANEQLVKVNEAIGAMDVRTQLAQGNLGQYMKKMGEDLGASAAAHTNAYEVGKQAISEPLTDEEQKTVLNQDTGVISRALTPEFATGTDILMGIGGTKLQGDVRRAAASWLGINTKFPQTSLNDADVALQKVVAVAGTRLAAVAAKGADQKAVSQGVQGFLESAKNASYAMNADSYLPGGRLEGVDREQAQHEAQDAIQQSVDQLRKQGVPDSALIGMLDAVKDTAASKSQELLRPSNAKGMGSGETKQMVRSFSPLKNAKTAVEVALRARGDQLARVDEQYGKAVSTAIASFATESGGDVDQFQKKMAELKVPPDVAEKLLADFSSRGEMPWQVEKILRDLKTKKSEAEVKLKQAGEKATIKGARASAKAGMLDPSAILGLTGAKQPALLGAE